MFVFSEECMCFFFFFQAEDGIRDIGVTGVQTCALPISYLLYLRLRLYKALLENTVFDNRLDLNPTVKYTQIGRASCRERV